MKLTAAITSFGLLAGLAATTAVASEVVPAGWVVPSPSKDYAAFLDRKVTRSGQASATIKSVAAQPDGWGNLMQTFAAGIYCGKRVRLMGHVKTLGATSAQLWMRVDGPGQILAFDNMANRPITGTVDWVRVELVLDVPLDAINISFGCLLRGTGQLWFDDLKFEFVGKGVAVTDSGVDPARTGRDDPAPEQAGKRARGVKPAKSTQPRNLDFEEKG